MERHHGRADGLIESQIALIHHQNFADNVAENGQQKRYAQDAELSIADFDDFGRVDAKRSSTRKHEQQKK